MLTNYTTEPRTAQVGLEPTISFFVCPTGIEPVPLVLQTSVRTSYTKGTIVGAEGFEPTTYAGYLIYSQAPNQFVRYSQFCTS